MDHESQVFGGRSNRTPWWFSSGVFLKAYVSSIPWGTTAGECIKKAKQRRVFQEGRGVNICKQLLRAWVRSGWKHPLDLAPLRLLVTLTIPIWLESGDRSDWDVLKVIGGECRDVVFGVFFKSLAIRGAAKGIEQEKGVDWCLKMLMEWSCVQEKGFTGTKWGGIMGVVKNLRRGAGWDSKHMREIDLW